jgi:hypothetical protein
MEKAFSVWSSPCPLLGGEPVNARSDTWHMFSMGSALKLYNESQFIAREIRLGNWNWEFRSCQRMGIQWRTTEYKRIESVVGRR